MEFSLILIIIGVLVGFYLIFKFVKKIIFTVFAVILLFVVAIASVFGLVYLDFKQLSSNTNFDVDLIYVNNLNYDFGTQIIIRNNSKIDLNSIRGISKLELSKIDINKITKDDNLFVVEVDSKIFDKLIANKTFKFNQFNSNPAFSSFKLEFSGDTISKLLKSKNAKNEFVTLILDKNNVKDLVRKAVKPVVSNEINNLPFSIKQILFLAVMQESLKDKNNIILLLKAYKNSQGINIYPNRYSFKLLKMLPINTIESYIPTNPLN